MAFSLDFDSPANIDEQGLKLIELAKKAIELPKNNSERDRIIDEAVNNLYTYFSTYSEERLCNFKLQLELFEVELLLKDEYLPINSEPIYNENQQYNIDNEKELLDYIIHCTRKIISKEHDLKNDSLEKTCPGTSSDLEKICDNLGVETVHLGVDKNLDHGMFHHFTIIKIPREDGNNKYYLADCTYRQFFTRNNCNPRRIGVMRGPASGCSIGTYMMMTKKRRAIAETILSQGYIELTPEVFREYFNAIVYSGRDKKYYDERGLDYTDPNSAIVNGSVEDYLLILYQNHLIDEREYYNLSAYLNERESHIRR